MRDPEVAAICKSTLKALILKRKEETSYKDCDTLPIARYIADPMLKWLMEQYDTLEKNTKNLSND